LPHLVNYKNTSWLKFTSTSLEQWCCIPYHTFFFHTPCMVPQANANQGPPFSVFVNGLYAFGR